jgi:anti-sigma regulatory factor (Ser/Thr protein kinase)
MTPLLISETERRFKFQGLPQAVGAARRVLRDWESHFEPDIFYDLSLCVSELVTNTVRRGEPGARDELELAVWRSETLVRAEIRQPRPDALVANPPAMDPSDWGMFIVDRVADRWGVDRSEGTLVWCEIDLAGDRRLLGAAS